MRALALSLRASGSAALLYEESISPRNELRALNWCSWLLAQVRACGVCARACVCVRVCARVFVCVCACVRVCT